MLCSSLGASGCGVVSRVLLLQPSIHSFQPWCATTYSYSVFGGASTPRFCPPAWSEQEHYMIGLSSSARMKRAPEQLKAYKPLDGEKGADIDIIACGDPFQLPPVMQKALWHQKALKFKKLKQYLENRAKLGVGLQNGLNFWDEFDACVLLTKAHRAGVSPSSDAWLRSQDLMVGGRTARKSHRVLSLVVQCKDGTSFSPLGAADGMCNGLVTRTNLVNTFLLLGGWVVAEIRVSTRRRNPPVGRGALGPGCKGGFCVQQTALRGRGPPEKLQAPQECSFCVISTTRHYACWSSNGC